jgi:hypothetical protein
VTIDPPSFNAAATDASSTMIADFAATGSGSSGTTTPADTSSGSSGALLLSDAVTHPIGLPLTGSE